METFLSNLTGKEEKNKMIRKLFNFDFFLYLSFPLHVRGREKFSSNEWIDKNDVLIRKFENKEQAK